MQTKVLIVVPNHWGKADTIAEAWKQLKKVSYKNLQQLKTRYKMYVVTDTDDVKSHVNELGGIVTPRGFPPHLIDEKD